MSSSLETDSQKKRLRVDDSDDDDPHDEYDDDGEEDEREEEERENESQSFAGDESFKFLTYQLPTVGIGLPWQ